MTFYVQTQTSPSNLLDQGHVSTQQHYQHNVCTKVLSGSGGSLVIICECEAAEYFHVANTSSLLRLCRISEDTSNCKLHVAWEYAGWWISAMGEMGDVIREEWCWQPLMGGAGI